MPLQVILDARGSSDPDGDALTYAWDADGDGAYDDSNTALQGWTYNTAGTYAVGLKVTDEHGDSATDTVAVTAGNTPPTATIASPSPGLQWKVGDLISFSGSATDRQDGTLGAEPPYAGPSPSSTAPPTATPTSCSASPTPTTPASPRPTTSTSRTSS